jgi:proteasome lid subunit RPN8/RPN11
MTDKTASTSAPSPDSPKEERPRDPSLDITNIDAGSYPHRALERINTARAPHFQTVFRQAVLDDIHAHGKSSLDAEICGVLVGNVYRDKDGAYLYIEHSIRGDRAEGHAAQVTFKAETWTHIQDVMDREHPDGKIVGWYHTHPGFGIFLSGMDLFISDNFFNLPWQIAFVYDPIGGDEGSFVWRAGKSEREPFLIEEPTLEELHNQPGYEWKAPNESYSPAAVIPASPDGSPAMWAAAVLAFILSFVAGFLMLSHSSNTATTPTTTAPSGMK